MNDREKRIAEIREVLEKATPGPWKWIDAYYKNDFEKYNMGGFVNEEGKLICHFGNRLDYYPTEGEPPDYYDELLIANAHEWLRFLLDELERMDEENRKMIETLRWYADEQNYDGSEFRLSVTEKDKGQRARDILHEIGVTVE